MAGARVRATLLVSDDSLPFVSPHWVRGRAVETDAHGRFELADPALGPLRLVVEGGGELLHERTYDAMEVSEAWDRLELVAPLRCRLLLETAGEAPPAQLLALLDEAGERLWIRVPEESAERMGGIDLWRGLPLWRGPGSLLVECGEDARTALFYDWNGTEIERRPIRLDPASTATLAW